MNLLYNVGKDKKNLLYNVRFYKYINKYRHKENHLTIILDVRIDNVVLFNQDRFLNLSVKLKISLFHFLLNY